MRHDFDFVCTRILFVSVGFMLSIRDIVFQYFPARYIFLEVYNSSSKSYAVQVSLFTMQKSGSGQPSEEIGPGHLI